MLFKDCPGQGWTWDLLVFLYFLSLAAPLTIQLLLPPFQCWVVALVDSFLFKRFRFQSSELFCYFSACMQSPSIFNLLLRIPLILVNWDVRDFFSLTLGDGPLDFPFNTGWGPKFGVATRYLVTPRFGPMQARWLKFLISTVIQWNDGLGLSQQQPIKNYLKVSSSYRGLRSSVVGSQRESLHLRAVGGVLCEADGTKSWNQTSVSPTKIIYQCFFKDA